MACLIRSQRYPHAALTRALSNDSTAGLITSYAETYVAWNGPKQPENPVAEK